MSGRDGLLSIGEMAKLTGVGIQALRYYERINILKPAYVDPDSGYRYYSFKQTDCVNLIGACAHLGIPLKELTDLFETEDSARLRDFFVRNKELAEKKLKMHTIMMSLADKALQKLERNSLYRFGQIYPREIPEKTYYIKPCGQSIKDLDRTKWLIDFSKEAQAELMLRLDGIDIMNESMVLMEYGFLCEYAPDSTQYYAFCEIPSCLAGENTIIIAEGTYFFRQDKSSKIEDAPQMFEQQIAGREFFMVIEVEELMSGKSKISEPIHELRLICS